MIQFHQTGIPARYCLLLFAALGFAMHTGIIRADDKQQTVEDPRVVVQENLAELPDVQVVSDDQDPDSSPVLVDKSDQLMEISRLPLTYVQKHVPFLTKRNIIFFGRFELDAAHYSSGVLKDDNGFNLRRFRLGLAGEVRFWPDWTYKLEVDLTDAENRIADVYLSRRSEKWGTFRFGNQTVAQTLSGQTSSISIPFMERPLPILAFSLKNRLAISWDTHLKKMGANISLFSKDPNEGVGSHGWAARGYFNPSRGKFQVTHIGGSFMQLSSDNDARISARPESYVTNIKLVDTGTLPDAHTASALGLELAGARGPVTFRSEFYRVSLSRSDAGDPKLKGFYAEASWFLTGETSNYREGKFIRPNILSDRGAWEIAARISSIDLNDLDVEGGRQRNLSFGVNWYAKIHWRFLGNLIKVRAKDGPYGKQTPWVVQFRVQYYF